uniref:Mechanosensitive ion channel n=1 Tax=Roseihalotalea indica TaxID=2867963 RepID=A0AA49JJ52_9BACT|nr:mechanosensitive ion channel [Tunicatimonas sp. TK19036]
MEFNVNDALATIMEKLEAWLERITAMLPNLVLAIFAFVVFLNLARLARRLFARVMARATNDVGIQRLLTQLLYYVCLSVGMFVVLEILELDKAVTSLIAGLGVVGIALGFAFQDIAANFIAGVILAFKKPFNVGDVVEIDGTSGVLDRTDFRLTVIRTFQGQEVYIPNKDVIQKKIINYSITGERRIDLKIGVSYGEDLEQVMQVTLDAVKTVEGVRLDKDIIFDYYGFEDSSINFNLRFWITFPGEPTILTIINQTIIAIKKAYDAQGITIPFPIRTLDFGIKGGTKLSELNLGAALNGDGKK